MRTRARGRAGACAGRSCSMKMLLDSRSRGLAEPLSGPLPGLAPAPARGVIHQRARPGCRAYRFLRPLRAFGVSSFFPLRALLSSGSSSSSSSPSSFFRFLLALLGSAAAAGFFSSSAGFLGGGGAADGALMARFLVATGGTRDEGDQGVGVPPSQGAAGF